MFKRIIKISLLKLIFVAFVFSRLYFHSPSIHFVCPFCMCNSLFSCPMFKDFVVKVIFVVFLFVIVVIIRLQKIILFVTVRNL